MKIFLHYSWDSETHKNWVLKLAERLISDGVNLFFDRYDLKPGSNNLHFMEQIEHADKIVIIMSEGYKPKVENRGGGVGYEYQILASVLSNSLLNHKIIPILRGSDRLVCIPTLLISYLYIDMDNDSLFEDRYIELLRAIFDEPEIAKPALGKKPDFDKPISSAKVQQASKVSDVFNLGWTRSKTKKVLGIAQEYVGIQEKYWSHGLEVYYNRHWSKVDGVLAHGGPTGVSYESEVYGIKIGDTFAEVKSKIGNPLNWGIPDRHLSLALYLINGIYLIVPIWRFVPDYAPSHIKQGTVMAIGVAAQHSVLACIPIVMIAIEEIRSGKRPTLLEHRRRALDYDPKADYWRGHYEVSDLKSGDFGGYFVTATFVESNKRVIFWLYDLSWDRMVIRALAEDTAL